MAMRRGTFKNLPVSLGLALYDISTPGSVTLDGNDKISSIENIFGNGSNPAITAAANSRRSMSTYNGFATSYSADTSHGGHLLTDTSGLPIGNADRHFTWVALSMDGVVCGYRGDGGTQYWVDNPYPDYRIQAESSYLTGTGSTDQNSLHAGSLNHRSGVTSLTVDGRDRGSFPVILNTRVGTFGFAGADDFFYPMKGHFLLLLVEKRAASADEQYKIDSAAQYYHGENLPAGHPYATTPWMVDDGATATTTGSSTSTLAGIGAVSAAGLAIVGAASLALASIGSTSTSSAPIAAQAQIPLGPIVSAGAGGISATGAGSAALQPIAAASGGALPIRGASASLLADVASSATSGLVVSGAASTTLGPVGTVSAARADVRGSASTSLASIVATSTAGGQSVATASSAAVLGPISTAATGLAPVVGTDSTTLATIVSDSGTALAVQGAGAASLGAIVSSSASSIPIGSIGSASLGGVRLAGRGGPIASAIASFMLGGIVGTSSASVGRNTDDQLVGPGWTPFATPRRFVASAICRSFIVSSTGCKRMLNFPPKYAHEVRNAVVDFAPALSEGESLTGQPTVAVMKGDLAVSAARTEGTAVHFTLSGGMAATKVVQWVEVHCQTDGDQVLEEVVSVTMLS